MGQDSATFRDNRTEDPSLSRDKGTTGQAKNLAKGRDGPGQPKFGYRLLFSLGTLPELPESVVSNFSIFKFQ